MKSFTSIDHKILPITYNDAGQFYFARVKTWLKAKKIFSKSLVL